MTQSVTELSLPTPKERRRLREAAELTHEEVAAAVGVTATTVRSWETGRTDPRGRKREAYAKLMARLSADAEAAPEPDPEPEPEAEAEAKTGAAPGTPAHGTAGATATTGTTGTTGTEAAGKPGAAAVEPEAETAGSDAGADTDADLPEPAAATPAAASSVSEDPGATTGAAGTDPDAASAVNATEGRFGLRGRAAARPVGSQTRPKAATKRAAKPPVGLPRHEAKAMVKTAVGGGGGLAHLRPGGPVPPNNTGTGTGGGPGAGTDTGPGASTGDTSTSTDAGPDAGTAPDSDSAAAAGAEAGPGDATGGTKARTAPEDARSVAAVSAFDTLYNCTAPALTRQAYLLTGRRALAQEAVERAFQQAWARWPEVATDPDPVGWVRAATYEYALSPWHQFRRAHKHPDKPPADPGDRILMDAMLALPPAHRRTVLLYDGVGLDLPDTAAETEASTPTAGGRLVNAHADLADRLPELAAAAPEKWSALLRERLGALTPAVRLEPRSAAVVRAAGEGRARLWTRAALGLTVMIAVAAAYTAATAPTEYQPPRAPGANVSGVPPHSGPQQLSDEGRQLHDKLVSDPAAGPARVSPKAE